MFQVVLWALGWGEAGGSKCGYVGEQSLGAPWWLHGQTQDGVTLGTNSALGLTEGPQNVAPCAHTQAELPLALLGWDWGGGRCHRVPTLSVPQHIGLPMFAADRKPKRIHLMSLGVLNLPRNPLLDWCFGHSLISCHVEHHLFPSLSDNMCLKVR